ncbi:hypothetical protein POSPLADRAFT_1047949 [Postia placenta MAD-698-R-SB12]|uniref:AB hydrolase-1 domain-containing protein n=1 Tax=Postia placenta MAD-698-R-SB12 TaxID=670580 RepID=A0A1X6MVW5_9APHY|nr:hypothetical protein POSPLADRAFT_1047949 [Postia placenta MAD-698-R-SB12]OSX60525.1 hypothetical protein POSPLADRAFT_1047949 [Postia placenta MAD-698-R-SB12]
MSRRRGFGCIPTIMRLARMSTNINDPAGVKALLDQLRSSQAWQDIAQAPPQQPPPEPTLRVPDANTSILPPPIAVSQATESTASPLDAASLGDTGNLSTSGSASGPPESLLAPSVASLLSQLQVVSSSAPQSILTRVSPPVRSVQTPQLLSPYQSMPEGRPTESPLAPLPSPARTEDLRKSTFQQALPHLARLSEDPDFVNVISRMKREQADLERQLWDERQGIQKKQEEKVKIARTKASMVGSGLTQFEADMLSDSFRKELRKFDSERVLPAWDGLVAKQQARLEALGVPVMYLTSIKTDRETFALRLMEIVQVSPSTVCVRGDSALIVKIVEPLHASEIEEVYLTAGEGVTDSRRCVGLCALGSLTADGYYLTEVDDNLPQWVHTVGIVATLATPYPVSTNMPYVDLVSDDDYASIWYYTNSPNGNVSGFDPDKPTIAMLHPLCLDSTFMHPQLDDPRLDLGYNIIVFDTRTTGKSLSRASGRHDLWVITADLAHCFHHLRLPPVHFFAPELYGYVALRFAVLFPEWALSVTLCNIPAQTELNAVFDAFEELVQLWAFAEDLESFEYSCKELLDLFVGTEGHPDLLDELVAYWEVHYPPFRRSQVIQNMNVFMNRQTLSPETLARITCPVVIMQAESSQTHPYGYAEELADLLIGTPDNRATVFMVKGKSSQGYLSLLSASIVNQTFHKFLRQQRPARSELKRPEISLVDRMRTALTKLSQLVKNSSIAMRDPLSPLSFSCLSADTVSSQEITWLAYRKEQSAAFSPLGADGRPLRKFSERKDHWLDGDADGFSYAKTREKKQEKKPPRRREVRDIRFLLPYSEPVSEEAQHVARIRRATIYPGAVDKHVIKGSMAKVVQNGNVPLSRLLR